MSTSEFPVNPDEFHVPYEPRQHDIPALSMIDSGSSDSYPMSDIKDESDKAHDHPLVVQSGPTNAQLGQALSVLDEKLTWIMNTLQWMSGVFNGIQSVAAMMPGKGGKMAREMMQQMNKEGTTHGE